MAPRDQATLGAPAGAEQQDKYVEGLAEQQNGAQGAERAEPRRGADQAEQEEAGAALEGPVSTCSATDLERGDDHAGRKAWKVEEHVIPKNNLILVFGGLILSTFLVSLDQTIVSAALPTIARDLDASSQGLSWVGSAYLREWASRRLR